MYRKITKKLEDWKKNKYRKPLILQGPRQCGKTYSVLDFGKTYYKNVAYFNFETMPRLNLYFEDNISPSYLIPVLSRISGTSILSEETLIVFDEVQLCERALTSLKYFAEEAPEYHVIALGSSLGVAVNRERYSFPVGKVDFLNMYPMDMEEFLVALGENKLLDMIKEAFTTNMPIARFYHDEAMKLYREYLVVGGMPECVMQYISTKDFLLTRHLQDSILYSYVNDMSKNNTENEIKKTRLLYDNVTVQLGKKNTRFQYKMVKSGGRAKEFENALEWLTLCGIITRVYKLDIPKLPMENYRNIDSFKVYFLDIGLLNAKKELNATDILYMDGLIDDFKGGMVENYVNSALFFNGYTTYYWESEREAKIDFVIRRGKSIIPVEVKSADNVRSRSLRVYLDRYESDYALRISSKNFSFENGIKTVPLYAVFCI